MYYSPNYQYSQYNNTPPYVLAQCEKRKIRKTSNGLCWTLLAGMVLMSGLIIVCTFYLKAFGYKGDYSSPNIMGLSPVLFYLASGTSYLIGLAVPVFLYFAIKHIKVSSALPFEKVGFLEGAACVFFGSAVCMLANIPANVVAQIQKAFGFSGNIPEYPIIDDWRVLVLYFVTIVIIPPLTEELLFRGMILHSLRKFGDGFAIVGSALLFGLYHGNFIQFVFAFIAGLIMAFVVVRTNSLWISIFIHFINNGISVGIEMAKRFGSTDFSNIVNTTVVLSILALGTVSIIYLIIKDKHFFRTAGSNVYLPLSSKLGALFFNPGGIAIIVFSLITSVNVLLNY
jgi:membrane protease YdiL (CAAX protease family)